VVVIVVVVVVVIVQPQEVEGVMRASECRSMRPWVRFRVPVLGLSRPSHPGGGAPVPDRVVLNRIEASRAGCLKAVMLGQQPPRIGGVLGW
jgi:hypothetical protein